MQQGQIKGVVLCRMRDEYGEIIVAEEGGTRSLCFGTGVVQSAIRTDCPHLLLEDYNEAIASALLFKSDLLSVLLIGLGGCSLVHFLLKAVPECAIDVVEIRQCVIDLSRDFFFLPVKNPKVRVFHAEGSDFVHRQRPDSRTYDLIIIDAFDEAGPAASLLEQNFLSSCKMLLDQNGVFVVNLWNSPKYNFPAYYHAVQNAFDGNALKLLLSESYRNAVAFGFRNSALWRNLPGYRPVAADLQRTHTINFSRYLKQLYWQNFKEQDQ